MRGVKLQKMEFGSVEGIVQRATGRNKRNGYKHDDSSRRGNTSTKLADSGIYVEHAEAGGRTIIRYYPMAAMLRLRTPTATAPVY